jgi:hypothetical protein
MLDKPQIVQTDARLTASIHMISSSVPSCCPAHLGVLGAAAHAMPQDAPSCGVRQPPSMAAVQNS